MTKEDYISRKEVREFVNFVQSIKDNHNEQGKPINYGTICDIVIRAHRLLDLPPVTPQESKWIPVSERLPKEDEDVLICTPHRGVTVAYYSTMNWFDEAGDVLYFKPIAWMPLPNTKHI